MKKLILSIALFLTSFYTSAQVFTVGDTTCNYKKINYTFTEVPQAQSSYYRIDLDNDNSFDIYFQSIHVFCNPTPSGTCTGYDNQYFKINSTANTSFIYGPPTGTNCTMPNALNNMSYGSSLQASQNWTTTGSPYLYYNDLYISWWPKLCGEVTDTFYVGFRKILNTDTVFGWLLMDSHPPGKLISYAYRYSSIINASFSVSQDSVCLGDSINLNQTGTGYFNGVGVKNNFFHSTTVGNYQVYTSDGCLNTSTLNITVLPPLPNPQIISSSIICKGDSLVLSGNPGNGIFSGSGVNGNVFYSANIPTDSVSIQYTISDQNGCSNTTTKIFSIMPLTYTMSTCLDAGFSLPTQLSLDGIFTGSGVYNGDYFDPSISGSGIIPVYFTSTCNKTATLNITVYPDPPKPQIINSVKTCCFGDKIPLIGLPSGGYFVVPSQSVGFTDTLFTKYFQPDILFYDTGKVVYYYGIQDINGCTSHVYDTIHVEYAYSPDSPLSSCPNTTFSLTGYPGGGTFIGTSINGNLYTAPSSIGHDYGYYNYTYPSGCKATYTLNLFTYDCVGIEENIKNDGKILIYPNPTADIIQLDLININIESSYKAKVVSIEGSVLKSVLLQNNNNVIDLSDLANGIYFIDVSFDHSVYRSKLLINR